MAPKALGLCVFFWCLLGVARGQTYDFTVLTTFNGTNGGYITWPMIQAPDGTLYGTAYGGGSNYDGTVYKCTTNGALTTLVNFSGTNGAALGAYPSSPLALGPDGLLYGTTFLGGSNNSGSVFKVTTNGVLTSLCSFAPLSGTRSTLSILGDPSATNASGGQPYGSLALGPDGNFYGTTVYGGSNGVGTVYRITTNGALTSLFSFDSITSNTSSNSTGAKPICGLTPGPDGNFYGVAAVSGSNGVGSVFQITTNGVFRALSCFSPYGSNGSTHTNYDGAEPSGALTLGPDGLFYGTTAVAGGNGSGTVFKISTNGVFTLLATFSPVVSNGLTNGDTYWYTNNNGAQPAGSLVAGRDGKLYGTASNGGLGAVGTVFSITTNGFLTPLFSFAQPVPYEDTYTNNTGSYGDGLILGMDGNFYGAAYKGGYANAGTLFRITPGSFNIKWISGKSVVTWSDTNFTLQAAPTPTSAFTSLPAAASPYTNSSSASQRYFRLIEN